MDHRARRRAILRAHPRVARLQGVEATSKYLATLLVVAQLCLAAFCAALPWPAFALLAYVAGATAAQALFLAVHELAHDLFFRSRAANKRRAQTSTALSLATSANIEVSYDAVVELIDKLGQARDLLDKSQHDEVDKEENLVVTDGVDIVKGMIGVAEKNHKLIYELLDNKPFNPDNVLCACRPLRVRPRPSFAVTSFARSASTSGSRPALAPHAAHSVFSQFPRRMHKSHLRAHKRGRTAACARGT
jgi:hypothetical protein